MRGAHVGGNDDRVEEHHFTGPATDILQATVLRALQMLDGAVQDSM